jgi:hypothetical protein
LRQDLGNVQREECGSGQSQQVYQCREHDHGEVQSGGGEHLRKQVLPLAPDTDNRWGAGSRSSLHEQPSATSKLVCCEEKRRRSQARRLSNGREVDGCSETMPLSMKEESARGSERTTCFAQQQWHE